LVNELVQTKNIFDIDANVDWRANVQLVKESITTGLSDTEFKYFITMAKMYNLNPFKKEIYAVKYGDKPAQTIVGRDGYYQLAKTTPGYNGYETEDHIEYGPDKKPLDTSWAKCTVWIKEIEHPIVEKAVLGEYNKGYNGLWKTMPITMIRKVAESRAFRRAAGAFGTYSEEEFAEEPKAIVLDKINEVKK
jgi:phage recombination protein Bet